jgi:hypothetical protein
LIELDEQLAVKVAFSFPQRDMLFAVMTGTFGKVPVPILIVFVAELSHVSTIHLTVYVVAVVNVTLKLVLVAPVFHNKSPAQLLAVRVTEPPLQTVSLEAVIIGVV